MGSTFGQIDRANTVPVGGAVRMPTGEGGARLLVTDVWLGGMLLNEARHRLLERLFGVPRDQANIVSLVAVLLLAERAQHKLRRLLSAPGTVDPSYALLAAASVREVLSGIAGPPARATPAAGTLLTVAVVGGISRAVAVRTINGLRTTAHELTAGFHRRYGWIADPGQLRERRARRELAATTGPTTIGPNR